MTPLYTSDFYVYEYPNGEDDYFTSRVDANLCICRKMMYKIFPLLKGCKSLKLDVYDETFEEGVEITLKENFDKLYNYKELLYTTGKTRPRSRMGFFPEHLPEKMKEKFVNDIAKFKLVAQ